MVANLFTNKSSDKEEEMPQFLFSFSFPSFPLLPSFNLLCCKKKKLRRPIRMLTPYLQLSPRGQGYPVLCRGGLGNLEDRLPCKWPRPNPVSTSQARERRLCSAGRISRAEHNHHS